MGISIVIVDQQSILKFPNLQQCSNDLAPEQHFSLISSHPEYCFNKYSLLGSYFHLCHDCSVKTVPDKGVAMTITPEKKGSFVNDL